MISLTFDQLNGEKIMLPVSNTTFVETKNEEGIYVIAYFNNEKFSLRCTLMDINRLITHITRPPMPFPSELKGLKGL